MDSQLLKYFKYDHLPQRLKLISKPFCELAEQMSAELPANEEREMAIRKLLESKDCAVRSVL